jgi:hypothetical protein
MCIRYICLHVVYVCGWMYTPICVLLMSKYVSWEGARGCFVVLSHRRGFINITCACTERYLIWMYLCICVVRRNLFVSWPLEHMLACKSIMVTLNSKQLEIISWNTIVVRTFLCLCARLVHGCIFTITYIHICVNECDLFVFVTSKTLVRVWNRNTCLRSVYIYTYIRIYIIYTEEKVGDPRVSVLS